MIQKRDNKFSPKERQLLIITAYGHFICHLNMLVFPAVVLPLTLTLNIKIAEVISLSFWMYFFFGITALPWGILSDRWKVRNMLFIFYSGAALSAVAAALLISSPMGLMLSLAGLGVFSGIYHPAGLGWISKDVKDISMGMAYNGMFGNLGLAVGPLLAGIVTWLYGPEFVYFVVGMMNLIGAILIIVRSEAEQEEKQKIEQAGTGGNLNAFLLLLLPMMLGGVVYRGVSVVIPTYFELKNHSIFNWLAEINDWSLSQNLVATTVTSVIFLVGMLGQYTGGKAAARFELEKSYLGFHLLTIPAVFSLSFVHDIPLVLLTGIYFFFLLGMQPIENTLVSKLTPSSLKHSAYGFKFVVTFGVGSLAVKLVAFLESTSGVSSVFILMGSISIILALSILGLIAYLRWQDVA
jgi:MFS family permease